MNYSSRQIEIIRTATELINERGIQQLTTKALAEKMGFSEPAIYRHFKNKTELLASILDYFGYELKNTINSLLLEKDKGIDKLKHIITYQFDHFSNYPAIVMVIFAEPSFQYEKELSNAVLTILKKKKELIVKILVEGQKDGSIRKDIEARQLATIFMGSMRFSVLQWRLTQYQHDLRSEGRKLAKTIEELLSP